MQDAITNHRRLIHQTCESWFQWCKMWRGTSSRLWMGADVAFYSMYWYILFTSIPIFIPVSLSFKQSQLTWQNIFYWIIITVYYYHFVSVVTSGNWICGTKSILFKYKTLYYYHFLLIYAYNIQNNFRIIVYISDACC